MKAITKLTSFGVTSILATILFNLKVTADMAYPGEPTPGTEVEYTLLFFVCCAFLIAIAAVVGFVLVMLKKQKKSQIAPTSKESK